MKGEPPAEMLAPLIILAFLTIILGVMPDALTALASQISAAVM